MKLLFFVFCFFYGFTQLSWARDYSTYTITNSPNPESIKTIVKKFTAKYDLYAGKRANAYEVYLQSWNPHVADWYAIPAGTKIYIESPTLPLGPGETPPNIKILSREDLDYLGPYHLSNKKLVFLLTTSIGDFNEQLNTVQKEKITSTQNSHFTLGLAGHAQLTQTKDYVSASGYWSKLSSTDISGDLVAETQMSIPAEIGMNAYWGRPYKGTDFAVYAGLDYENFPTYNTQQFLNHEPLGFNTNSIFYATVGLEQGLFWGDNKANFKLSFAKTIHSSNSSYFDNDSFTGYRLLFFANYKINNRFSCHLLYKHHQLSGFTELQINRIGIGVSYLIF